ncbi:MAG: phosphate ABC transporter substrate-binding protein [Ignavibacteriota bacterium]
MKKNITIALFSFAFLFVFGCKGSGGDQAQNTVVTVKGSDTMVQLAQIWAEKYMAVHKDMQIQVTGGGSGTGISSLINGTTDLCNASRPMKDAEKQQLLAKYKIPVTETVVARDGITIYVNPENKIKDLSFDQLQKIYLGEIKNWKEVGGKDAPIILYGRENSSGTYAFFKEHVLANKDFTNFLQAMPGTAAVVNAVKKDVNGIGYGGAGYAKEVKETPIKKDANGTALLPIKENIDNNSYPLSRNLYIYTSKPPEGKIKEYIDWMLSPEGQALVREQGYFTVK